MTALIPDLKVPRRSGFIGVDNAKVGGSAAWALSVLCGPVGTAAIPIGSHRPACPHAAEGRWCAYLRERRLGLVVDSLMDFEQPRSADKTARDLIERNPDLRGLFVAGGGLEGGMEGRPGGRA